jgi:1-deoxy-D-xylulose-5-phosphate reductoisomerase
VLSGQQAAAEVAALDEVDQVMAAIVGAAGLVPTLAAIRAGKTVLLANKESLVTCGRLFMEAVQQYGAHCCRSIANITRFFRVCRNNST